MALITLREAAFAYGSETVLSGLNFEINQKDFLCVVGDNGAGKSTLIKGLLGLMPPRNGSVSFGNGLTSSRIGYLPQQTAAQKDFPASAFEVALSGRLGARGLRPFYTRADKRAAEAAMDKFGVLNLRNKCYRELSGGQQRRVLLARALCAAKKLLVMDEPVTGLDPASTREMYSLISGINSREGTAVVMVSHDISNAVKYAGLMLHLSHKQLFFGPTQDYINSTFAAGFIGG